MEGTKKQNVVIKIGGTFLDDEARLFLLLSELTLLQKRYTLALVHGGGNAISAYSRSYGIEARFSQNGLRLTSSAEMLHADRILSGEINTHLVRMALGQGIDAVGLSAVDGALIDAHAIEAHTGRVESCNPRVVETLSAAGYLPIICPVASTREGVALNVNADEVAHAIARAWPAQHLVLISDVAGIIIAGQHVPCLSETEITQHIQSGAIYGGMIPKTQNALSCLHNGVQSVIIGTLTNKDDLAALLEGGLGTRIVTSAP